MRVRVLYLFVFPLYGSGSGTYARSLAEEVAKDHDAAVVCPDNRSIRGVKTYSFKPPLKVSFTGHPEWRGAKLFREITERDIFTLHKAYMDVAVSAVENFKPNIIHVHHAYPFSWAARFIKSTYDIPYVITVHGSELPTVQKDKRYVALTIDALRRSRIVAPNSFYTRDWMYKVFGREFKNQIRVIPGGVDAETFRKVNTESIDRRFGLAEKKVVVFAGKLTVYKGVQYLVKAAKKIKGEVLILGDGPDRKHLEQIAKARNIKNVRFLGHFGEKTNFLVQLYSRADVFVAPSVWDEPLGLVILEAMACEVAVVVTRKGGIPLAVKEGVNGLFIKPRNTTEIVEKVNSLLNDDKKRKVMAQQAREIVVRKFSWTKIAQQYISYYEKYGNFKINGKLNNR